jgi:hypothetical protein
MLILLIFILAIGLAGLIGNQYSGLRKMDHLQRSLDDLNQKITDMNAITREPPK